MRTAIAISVLMVAACLCGVLVTIDQDLRQLPVIAVETRNMVLQDLAVQTDATRTAVLVEIDKQAGALRVDANTQLSGIRREALGQVVGIRSDFDRNLQQTTADLDRTVKGSLQIIAAPVNVLIADLAPVLTYSSETIAAVKPVLEHAASIANQVDNNAPLFLDCENNPDCVYNRFQGVSKATEKTMQAVAVAAPQLATSAVGVGKSADGIARSVDSVAEAYAKPTTVFGKIWGVLKTAAGIWAHTL